VLGQLGRWMDSEGVEPGELDMAAVGAFRAARRAGGDRRVASVGELRQLVLYLREVGVMAAEGRRALTPLEELIADYRRWLGAERELAAPTVLRYEKRGRRFLGERVTPEDELGAGKLTGADVSAFLVRECARVSLPRRRDAWPSSAAAALSACARSHGRGAGGLGAAGRGLARDRHPAGDLARPCRAPARRL
jgi:integrase/recombinase XerD